MTRHTDKEIEQAASRFEQLADSLDPDTASSPLPRRGRVGRLFRALPLRLRKFRSPPYLAASGFR